MARETIAERRQRQYEAEEDEQDLIQSIVLQDAATQARPAEQPGRAAPKAREAAREAARDALRDVRRDVGRAPSPSQGRSPRGPVDAGMGTPPTAAAKRAGAAEGDARTTAGQPATRAVTTPQPARETTSGRRAAAAAPVEDAGPTAAAAPAAQPREGVADGPGAGVAAGNAGVEGSSTAQAASASNVGAPRPTRRELLVEPERIRVSPFQPPDRPSAAAVDAVRQLIELAGSPAALRDDENARLLARLDAEARDLAELVIDVALNGLDQALDVREVGGELELLSGHRRRAAAMLVGLSPVKVTSWGPLADATAAAIVSRLNRLRRDFTPWQEAMGLGQLEVRRREAGLPVSVRDLATVMGYALGRASELLQIARAFPPAILAELGGGRVEVGHGHLSRLTYRKLRRLAQISDDLRLAEARRTLGLLDGDAAGAAALAEATVRAYERVERRGGGYTFTVLKAVERLSLDEAREVAAALEAELQRVRQRIKGQTR